MKVAAVRPPWASAVVLLLLLQNLPMVWRSLSRGIVDWPKSNRAETTKAVAGARGDPFCHLIKASEQPAGAGAALASGGSAGSGAVVSEPLTRGGAKQQASRASIKTHTDSIGRVHAHRA